MSAHLNYVNSFPVDAIRYGIQTLSPKLFGSKPDFVFSGNNIGNNLGPVILISGLASGAATEAALEGIPSVAFSGDGGAQVSYTTLSNHTLQSTIDATIYGLTSLRFIHQLLDNPGPILPVNISLNVNYPSTANCTRPEDFKFVLTRILPSTNATDFHTCGATTLPDETSVLSLTEGCFSSVSVFSATNKSDVSAATQAVVHKKLAPILSCLKEN
ncbi:hypothetical protein H0H92_005241 [Tricholoma furcatifolium]|nr:hypothetical protein H0H92_005241 [Tricholoma furcatifolium]